MARSSPTRQIATLPFRLCCRFPDKRIPNATRRSLPDPLRVRLVLDPIAPALQPSDHVGVLQPSQCMAGRTATCCVAEKVAKTPKAGFGMQILDPILADIQTRAQGLRKHAVLFFREYLGCRRMAFAVDRKGAH